MHTMTIFANFPDRFDDMRIPFCLDWSVHSGYLAVGTHSGRALLYRYDSALQYFFMHFLISDILVSTRVCHH